jgi:hypothetical protein
MNTYGYTGSRRQRGGAVTELAVTMPFVFLLMIGAVDFGRMWTLSTRLSDAAYAGAAYGAQTAQTAKDTQGIREVVLHELGLASDEGPAMTHGTTAAISATLISGPLGAAQGGNGGGNGNSGSGSGSGADSTEGDTSEGKTVRVDEYEILVGRYCQCEDESPVDCDTGTCTAGGGNRRTYVRVKIGTNFTTIFDYPGVPPVIELEREARLRAR